ncbi:ROK family protein [Candidatus Woesearchaeota archaeon]|nr:ROK family protein [Candidatus Woesearchaeota archaeon]
MENIIGVDLGGTNIKSALISPKGKIIKKYETATEAKKGAKEVIKNIFSSIQKVKSGKIKGIGIGSPGPMDYKKGIIKSAVVNLPLRNVPLRKIIQKKFKIPTFLDNDANCFALAEAVFGQGKNYENVVGITLGTGIGGGIVINKKIFHGRSNAAEFGHMTIKYDGSKSRCGNHGCIETLAAARGITAVYGSSSPHLIHKLALQGNKKAIRTYEKIGYYLGIGLANIMYALDPDIIVIGGKISNAWKLFSKSMNKTVGGRYFAKPCKIVKSKLKDAGILGAGALVLS